MTCITMNSVRSFAIGEVEALVLKAYRGAGFSWGMAQEAGKAAGWLTARQLPALDAFASLLDQTVGQPHHQLAPCNDSDNWPAIWTSSSTMMCPVIAGALISDMSSQIVVKEPTITLVSVPAPIILLPFVASLGVPVMVGGADFEIHICGDAIDVSAGSETLISKNDVVLELAGSRVVLPDDTFTTMQGNEVRAMRGGADPASIQLLEGLAHHTYVPATQASRESGAGAGLTDDD